MPASFQMKKMGDILADTSVDNMERLLHFVTQAVSRLVLLVLEIPYCITRMWKLHVS